MKQIRSNSIVLAVCLCFLLNASAQKHKPDHYSIAVTTLHTAFPFSSFSNLFVKEFHPGFEIGCGFNWKTKTKHDWFQTSKFGYSYNRFVQHSLVLYSESGYRYKFLKTFSAEAKFGLGYLHAISTEKVLKLQSDGYYKKKFNIGRPQAMAGFSFVLNKKITASGANAFLEYQQRIQLPFIKSYVPFLPSNILMAGVKIPFKKNN
jgi:hypothetical protein